MVKRRRSVGDGGRVETRWCRGHGREEATTEFPKQPPAVRGKGPFCREALAGILVVDIPPEIEAVLLDDVKYDEALGAVMRAQMAEDRETFEASMGIIPEKDDVEG